MREKQLRKQQQEQGIAQSQVSTAAQKQPVIGTTSTPTPTQPSSVPARQRITVKPKVAPAKPAVAVADAHTTEPPVTANVGPKDLPVRLAKRQRIAAGDTAAVPAHAPTLPVQQTPVLAATQPDLVVSLAKKPRTAAAPTPASTPTPLPVQQTPVSSTAQPEKPVSLAKKPKMAAASVSAPAPAPLPVQQTSISGTAQAQAQTGMPESLAKKPKTTTTTAASSPVPLPVLQAPVLSIAQPDTTLETSPLKKSPENKGRVKLLF